MALPVATHALRSTSPIPDISLLGGYSPITRGSEARSPRVLLGRSRTTISGLLVKC